MNILFWVIFGLIVGTVANLIDPEPSQGGWFGAMILGILGAMLGGFLGNMVFGIGISGFNFPSLAVAVLGALFLLFIGKAFGRA
jgi:uncharacterized membrane protein YeaQ/YmgE (transglycosylase-associated protein family)